ncbi:MAG: acyl-CoA dehydrogenase family protein, partial [Microthrixaceae bacterium]|nr:acyl-CoA dehydrogenase family protein [Microthrixaceae bacterium]
MTDAATSPVSPDLTAAAAALDVGQAVIDSAVGKLAELGIDDNQVLAYDVAHAAAALMCGRGLLDYGSKGDDEGRITAAFIADALADLGAKVFGREAEWGVEPSAMDGARDFVSTYRASGFLASLADTDGPRHLGDDFEMVQDAFRRFAEDKIMPIAEEIHRHNGDIPEEIISGLAEMGAF